MNLVKVRALDKFEKEQQKIKQNMFSTLASKSSLEKMVFERFYEDLVHFQFKVNFYHIGAFNVQNLKISTFSQR